MSTKKATTGWQSDGSLVISDSERKESAAKCEKALRQMQVDNQPVKSDKSPKVPAHA